LPAGKSDHVNQIHRSDALLLALDSRRHCFVEEQQIGRLEFEFGKATLSKFGTMLADDMTKTRVEIPVSIFRDR
jgi:hypothetical protein